MIYNTVMIRINIHEAKVHLSRYLKRLARGEVVVICKRNVPVAELRPIPPRRATRRRMGLDEGKVTIPPEFYEPLPAELLEAFGEKQAPHR